MNFLLSVKSFHHQTFNWLDKRFFEIFSFIAFSIVERNNIVIFFIFLIFEDWFNVHIFNFAAAWFDCRFLMKFFQSAFGTLYDAFNELSTFCAFFDNRLNAMTSWSDFVTISSFIAQSTIYSDIFEIANVRSSIDCDMSECDVYVLLFEILINSQLNRLIHEINSFARIGFWIFEFHHQWCALKSLHIIAISKMPIDVNFRSTV